MTTSTAPATRRTLAALNEGFRREVIEGDFRVVIEKRVGKYGLRRSNDGHASRGMGGKLAHLVTVHVIAEILPSFDPMTVCSTNIRNAAQRERERAQHGKPWHHCPGQPKVGDLFDVSPACVDQNARGTAAFEPSTADTDAINCSNCLTRVFGETPEPRAKIEAREKAERAAIRAAKPAPPKCPHCGDNRPRTKATERGEQVDCSHCADLKKDVARYSKGVEFVYCTEGGYRPDQVEPWMIQRTAELLARATERLAKREGKYAR